MSERKLEKDALRASSYFRPCKFIEFVLRVNVEHLQLLLLAEPLFQFLKQKFRK